MSRAQTELSAETTPEVRFAFGTNWRRFLSTMNEERIELSCRELTEMLGKERFKGLSFLDIGSGSGLSSLAAMRLGAARVHSFDSDPECVACTEELRSRYLPDGEAWTIERGDATDPSYVESLGSFDIVYSWGVLHHTGQMWRALNNACGMVAPGGLLFVAIYNDQGVKSRVWRAVKRAYNHAPHPVRWLAALTFAGYQLAGSFLKSLLRRDLNRWLQSWTTGHMRGMSRWHDVIDWLGGYPFEVARPDEVIAFCRARSFEPVRTRIVSHRSGCNEFVFRHMSGSATGHE